jgi:hypothetical protein
MAHVRMRRDKPLSAEEVSLIAEQRRGKPSRTTMARAEGDNDNDNFELDKRSADDANDDNNADDDEIDENDVDAATTTTTTTATRTRPSRVRAHVRPTRPVVTRHALETPPPTTTPLPPPRTQTIADHDASEAARRLVQRTIPVKVRVVGVCVCTDLIAIVRPKPASDDDYDDIDSEHTMSSDIRCAGVV